MDEDLGPAQEAVQGFPEQAHVFLNTGGQNWYGQEVAGLADEDLAREMAEG